MTTNQVEYAKLVETRRNNIATANLRSQELEESKRSNLERESYNRAVLGETERSNKARESETFRHNREAELLGWNQLDELVRSNEARENETHRANVARESETARHNQTTEVQMWDQLAEQARANEARELETERHNRATEELSWANLDLGQGQLEETRRHNVESEELGKGQLALGQAQLRETQRHNQATEDYNWSYLDEQIGWKAFEHDLARDQYEETVRHNAWMTGVGFTNALSHAANALGRMFGQTAGEVVSQLPPTYINVDARDYDYGTYQGGNDYVQIQNPYVPRLQGSQGQARLPQQASVTYSWNRGGKTFGGGAGRR